jgi:hypothetical protein
MLTIDSTATAATPCDACLGKRASLFTALKAFMQSGIALLELRRPNKPPPQTISTSTAGGRATANKKAAKAIII